MMRIEGEMGCGEKVDWGMGLPKDVLYEIFRRLDFEEIGNARLGCRGWRLNWGDCRIVTKLPM